MDPYERTTAMVITPTVVKEVRAQFGCNTLPGAALENEGGQGSANAHWEYRWFQVRGRGQTACLFGTQQSGASLRSCCGCVSQLGLRGCGRSPVWAAQQHTTQRQLGSTHMSRQGRRPAHTHTHKHTHIG